MLMPKMISRAAVIALAATLIGIGQVRAVSLAPLGQPQLWKRLEFRVDGLPVVAQPFDPDVFAVDATFTMPSGRQMLVPAFWYQGYRRTLQNGTEVLATDGTPQWRVRFTPPEPGDYAIRLSVSQMGQTTGEPVNASFTVPEPSPGSISRAGWVRVAADGHYLETDQGMPLPLIGANVCWPGNRGTYDYDDWFGAMGTARENFARLWMAPWAFGIEAEPGTRTHYRLDRAWQLDYVLQLAETTGVNLLLALDYHGMFEVTPDSWGGNNDWPKNPYNAAQGGPCTNQNSFFTSAEAGHIYQKRLRYLVARYGCSPNLLAWEFFNEIDNEYSYLNASDVAAWHGRMGVWLHANDPWHHLVTTSFSGGRDHPEIWQLPGMDFATYHSYNLSQPATGLGAVVQSFLSRYHKPVLVEEYGVDWRGWGATVDPYLRGLRQGVWSGAFNGSAGTAMSWWWENLHSAHVYPLYSALADFASHTAWGREEWNPVTFQTAGDPPALVGEAVPGGQPFTAQLNLNAQWGAKLRGQLAVPNPLSAMDAASFLESFVHGSAHSDLRIPLRISAWLGADASLVLHLNSVSSGAIMSVTVDGAEKFRQSLPNKDGGYQVNNEYNQDFTVALPAGKHLIEVRNPGVDWFYLDWVRLQNALPAEYLNQWKPSPAAVGIHGTNESLLYVVSPAANYPVNATTPTLDLVTNASITISNLAPGRYRAFWYDPKAAKWINQTVAESDGSTLVLPLPPFNEDLAGRLIPDFEFGPLRRLASGSTSIQLTGELGHTFLMEASTNLQTWAPISTMINTNGTLWFSDPAAANSSSHFYRATEQE
jgi:Domain of unknown function (DUF5060)